MTSPVFRQAASSADPRVVVDGRPLIGNRTGIGVNTAEILKRLHFDPAPIIGAPADIVDRSGFEHCEVRVQRAGFGVLWQQVVLPRIAGDVVWGVYGTLPLALRKPAVVSLNDLTPITMPERHTLKTIVTFSPFIGRSLRMAHRVAAISRVTADEAIRLYDIAPGKIEIVRCGVDEFFSPGGEEGDYVLYAGTLEPRKGVDMLLSVWASLPTPRPRLVLCGAPGWRTPVPARDGIEVTGFVSRARLRDLYRSALAFVYPSRYEGFGLPPLEAMACGAPVIATRTGAIAEYAQGAAMLIAPNDSGALASALRQLLADAGLRRELRSMGPERAARYRWDPSARLMGELLRNAARSG